MAENIRFFEKDGTTYVDVQHNGKRHRYKYDERFPLDAYLSKAQSMDKRAAQRSFQAYKKTLAQHAPLNSLIENGAVSHTTTLEALDTMEGIRTAYKALLRPLVRDEGLLNLVVHNRHKLRQRLAYTITLKNKDGAQLGRFHDIGRYTIEELSNTYRNKLFYRPGSVIGSNVLLYHAATIGLPKEAVTQSGTGTIASVEVRITFRKL